LETRAKCPRDSSPLETHVVGPGRFSVCNRCHGIWVEAADLDSYLEVPSESWKLPLPKADGADVPRHDNSARCLCAGSPWMETRKRDGVKVDVCPQCNGVWLDGGELALLLERGQKPESSHSDVMGYELVDFVLKLLLFLAR